MSAPKECQLDCDTTCLTRTFSRESQLSDWSQWAESCERYLCVQMSLFLSLSYSLPWGVSTTSRSVLFAKYGFKTVLTEQAPRGTLRLKTLKALR